MTVYQRLRRLVVDGELPVGLRVSEAELSTRLEVSRTPVREALSRLEGAGLVDAQGRGVRVRALEPDELAAVFEARAALESWAAGRAAERVAAGEVAPIALRELQALADAADAATRAGELETATRANRAFHQSLARLAANPAVDEALDGWWDRIVVATRHGLEDPPRVEQVDDEHRRLIAALAAGDPAGAREAAEAHALRTIAIVKGRSE
ncbi:GntR family transcriptional regulator [Agromyces lapidis]|uniref:GntR family transcriptional regulator n=1 Tax=Agromyces lapidis TaxID=279574 RepID=A0ABV5SSY5_9MICO|nr:GntR family transcriptional regulator [Agromyces lapidis]